MIQAISDVWANSGHGGTELLVLLKLADYANEGRVAYPAVATLAKFCRVSERTVQRALRSLEATGEIVTVKAASHATTTRYRIACERGDILSPRGATHVTPGVPPMSPEPSVEPSVHPPVSPPTQEDKVLAVWTAWLEATGRERSRLDKMRRTLIRARLKDYELQDLIDCVRGWKCSPWHRGDNPEGRKYNDIEFLLRITRTTNNVEKFRDLWREHGDVERRQAAAWAMRQAANDEKWAA